MTRGVLETVQSTKVYPLPEQQACVPYHVAGFAMLCLIPVMVFGCVLVI